MEREWWEFLDRQLSWETAYTPSDQRCADYITDIVGIGWSCQRPKAHRPPHVAGSREHGVMWWE